MLSRMNLFEQVNIVNGDIRNLTDVLKAMQNVDTVYHLAAVNGTENFYYHSKLVLDVGIKGILNIMEAAEKYGTNHIIALLALKFIKHQVLFYNEKDVKNSSSLNQIFICGDKDNNWWLNSSGKNLSKCKILIHNLDEIWDGNM